MLHCFRGFLIGFFVAVLGFAVLHYTSMTPRLAGIGKQLVPMGAEQGTPNPAGTTQPTADHAPTPPSADSSAPVFEVDVEGIPAGMTARGTSFPLGSGLWLTARHVVGDDCEQIVLIIDGKNVFAKIKYLDQNADLAVLQTEPVAVPPLPIEAADPNEDDGAFAFGFPKGTLGATADQLLGRARMKLGGRLAGIAPVLTWAELDRYPESFESLSGISGGPMLDENGNVIGIIVAASVRRGRNYTVAPEILRGIQSELGLTGPQPAEMAARDVVTQPVSLDTSAHAMSKNGRIVLTYCIPPGS